MMESLSLFPDMVIDVPTTDGIKYTGSKLALIPYILQLARRVGAREVLDAFSGTTRVSQAFAKTGHKVISNDLSVWSEVFGTCYLLNQKQRMEYRGLIDHLNTLQPKDGWFTEHYGGQPNGGSAIQKDGFKRPWQIQNTRKLDAIREEIDQISLNPVEKAVAITSLILALDRVDNTLGHFVSYLQEWSPRSYNQLVLRIPEVFENKIEHRICRSDIFELVPEVDVDLAYLDPPYGSNNEKMPPSRVRYASYYHLWTTICLNDRPALFGKAKRRKDSSDLVATSVFEEFRKNSSGRFVAVEAIDRLLRELRAQWVILSYSSGGRATAMDLNDVISSNGKVIDLLEINYKKNVMAGMKWTNEWTREANDPNVEFLFLIKKR